MLQIKFKELISFSDLIDWMTTQTETEHIVSDFVDISRAHFDLLKKTPQLIRELRELDQQFWFESLCYSFSFE